jgi:hypothetical protein
VAPCTAEDFGGKLTGESKYSVCSAASVLALVSSCCANTEPAPPDEPVRVDMLNSRTLCCAFPSRLRSEGSSSSFRSVLMAFTRANNLASATSSGVKVCRRDKTSLAAGARARYPSRGLSVSIMLPSSVRPICRHLATALASRSVFANLSAARRTWSACSYFSTTSWCSLVYACCNPCT